jgi:LPXTG-site transpeptidase (sortase) family protein
MLISRRGLGAALVTALAVTAIAGGVACGGGGKKDTTKTPGTVTVTKTAGATPTPGANAGLKTPIPISPGSTLLPSDLEARGHGEPGRGEFTGTRLVVPSVGIDAPFSYKVVGSDGQMPNPDGPEDVSYYDFSQWPGLGGLPGKGGNIVVAGHVDYINYGPAVFWRLHELEPGDMVTIQMADGSSVNYKIEFNKQIEVGDADWSGIVDATADESITLITCGGEFEAGHYNNRQIIWGRKV